MQQQVRHAVLELTLAQALFVGTPCEPEHRCITARLQVVKGHKRACWVTGTKPEITLCP